MFFAATLTILVGFARFSAAVFYRLGVFNFSHNFLLCRLAERLSADEFIMSGFLTFYSYFFGNFIYRTRIRVAFALPETKSANTGLIK